MPYQKHVVELLDLQIYHPKQSLTNFFLDELVPNLYKIYSQFHFYEAKLRLKKGQNETIFHFPLVFEAKIFFMDSNVSWKIVVVVLYYRSEQQVVKIPWSMSDIKLS